MLNSMLVPPIAVVRIALFLVLLGAPLLASCTSGTSAPDEQASPPARILPPEQDEDARGREASGVRIVESDYRLEGRILNDPFDLSVGDCFNQYIVYLSEVEPQDLTTVLECSVAHDAEVYHQVNYPADAETPYPSSEELEAWSTRQCYEEFENFVGQEYELSELSIGFRTPTGDTWADPLKVHREVTCYVNAWKGGQVVGSVRGSGI